MGFEVETQFESETQLESQVLADTFSRALADTFSRDSVDLFLRFGCRLFSSFSRHLADAFSLLACTFSWTSLGQGENLREKLSADKKRCRAIPFLESLRPPKRIVDPNMFSSLLGPRWPEKRYWPTLFLNGPRLKGPNPGPKAPTKGIGDFVFEAHPAYYVVDVGSIDVHIDLDIDAI